MRIGVVVDNLDFKNGGVSRSVKSYLELLNRNEVAYLYSNDINLSFENGSSVVTEKIKQSPLDLGFFYAVFLNKRIRQQFASLDILVIHGLWSLKFLYLAIAARVFNIPYVIYPHGHAMKWSRSVKYMKKKLALLVYQNWLFSHAKSVIVNSELEREEILDLVDEARVKVIPNFNSLKKVVIPQRKNKPKNLLFVSRLHPKKGIEILFKAYANIKNSLTEPWRILLVGTGEPKYKRDLIKLTGELKIVDDIVFVGYKEKQDLVDLYLEGDIFVLPTYSENFGHVILEALWYGLPVITTKNTPWRIIEEFRLGSFIELNLIDLEKAIIYLTSISDEERHKIGSCASQIVRKQFDNSKIARDTNLLFSSLRLQT